MVSWEDYRGDGKEEYFEEAPKEGDLPKSFVPNDLLVFRHFGLAGPRLEPTGIKPMGHDWSDTQVHYPHEGDWTAICQKPGSKEEHPVPDHKCTCGFYASYDPEVDFYKGYLDFRFFAACKVSGRVIMGTKGVRAQKIKIVGMWLDPETRQVDVAAMEQLRNARKSEDWFRRGWTAYDVITAVLRMKAAGEGMASRTRLKSHHLPQAIADQAAAAAFQDYDKAIVDVYNTPAQRPDMTAILEYGIPIFDTREELLKAFPAEDVSGLIG